MQFKNLISYIIYGFKNHKLHLLSFIINSILLLYAILEYRERIFYTSNEHDIYILLVIFLLNFIWQLYGTISDFILYFHNKLYSEIDIEETNYEKFISSDECIEKISTLGVISYNSNLCVQIREKTFKCLNNKTATKKVNSYIKTYFDFLFPFLYNHFKNITFNRKAFRNDAKLCLSGKIIYGRPVNLCKGYYYNTYLTNKIFSKALFVDYSPIIYPPYCSIYQAISLPFEYFSNEIGVSTLAITSDGYLFFQQQGNGADNSPGLIVPSGSGSADWKDYNPKYTLDEIISVATKRELSEETGYGNKHVNDIIIKNKVLGMFRWLNLGGKPEFVSITLMRISINDIHPLHNEQHFHLHNNFCFRIINKNCIDNAELEKCWEIMNNAQCSIPLYMNLKILKEYIENEKNKEKLLKLLS